MIPILDGRGLACSDSSNGTDTVRYSAMLQKRTALLCGDEDENTTSSGREFHKFTIRKPRVRSEYRFTVSISVALNYGLAY